MERLSRRGFVEAAGAAAAGAWMSPLPAAAAPDTPATDRTVYLAGDGIGLSPRAYAALLAELTAKAEVDEDSYLLGGEIEPFERHWATLLGKETRGLHALGHPGQSPGAARAGRRQAPGHRARDEPHLQRHRRRLPDAVGPHADAARPRRGQLHARRRRGRAGAHGERPGRHRRRRHRHREPGPAAVGSDVRLGRADRRRGARPRARHRPPPRRRADVHRLGLHRPQPGRVRGAVRHGLRVAVEVLQQRPGRDPRRPAPRARRHVPHPPDVRRQPRRGLAGGAGRPALHGRLRGAAAECRRGVGGVLSRHRRAPAGVGGADPERHEPGASHAQRCRCRRWRRAGWPNAASGSRRCPAPAWSRSASTRRGHAPRRRDLVTAFEQALA